MTIKQLYPDIAPIILLDFVNGQVVDPRVSFTRASVGTYTDSQGIPKEVAINQPRFDHTATTLEPTGLLIEGQRTNFLLRNTDLSNAAWRKVNATVALTTTGGAGTPLTASIITASSADAWVAQYGSGSTAGAHAFTILARRRTGTGEVRVSRGQNTGGAGVGPILFSETFDNNNNGWFWNGTWSITGGQFVGTALTTIMPATVPLPATMVAGLSYSVTYTIVSITGSIRPRFDQGLQGIEASTRNTAGTFTDIIRMNQGNTQYRYFPTTNNTDVVIDNITIRPYMPAPITLTSQWQRLDLGQDTTNSVRPQPALAIYMATSGDQIDVAYAQGEAGTTPSSSIPTTGAAATRAADILQATLSSLGAPNSAAGTYVVKSILPQLATTANQTLLDLSTGAVTQVARLVNQPTRTNSVRNPRAEGAVAGTPGTAPTFWGSLSTNRTIHGVTTARSNLPLLDIEYTFTGADNRQLGFDSGVIAASPGQVWSSTVYVYIESGSVTARLDLEFRNSSGTFVNAVSSVTVSTQGVLHKLTATGTAAATVARVTAQISFSSTGATTFRAQYGVPQMELGSFPTSPILPPVGAPATSTRPAGTITLINEASVLGNYSYADVGTATANSATNVALLVDGSGSAKACVNAGTVQTISNVPVTGFTTLRIGNDVSNTSSVFGDVKWAAIYPDIVLSDSQLQSLTK